MCKTFWNSTEYAMLSDIEITSRRLACIPIFKEK